MTTDAQFLAETDAAISVAIKALEVDSDDGGFKRQKLDSLFELKKKFQTCISTLNSIGVSRDKIIFVLNKSDLLTLDEINEKAKYLDLTETKKWIHVSSVSAQNIQELKKLIGKILAKQEPIRKKVKKFEFDEIYEN